MASQKFPTLPFEVIEDALIYLIYDRLFAIRERKRTLYNCMLTCRALVPRSRYLLFLHLDIPSHHAYKCLSRFIRPLRPLISRTRELMISDEHHWDLKSEKPCALLFMHRFAYHLSRLERLIILDTDWADSGLHDSFFPLLRRLTLLTSLSLHHCIFTSALELHRVLCALLALTTLELDNVTWKNRLSLKAGSPSRFYGLLHLDLLSVSTQDPDQMLGWFVRTTASTSLRALDVRFDDESGVMLKPMLEHLGPSLESLDLEFGNSEPASHDDDILASNNRLKSFTIARLRIAVVSRLLAQITSTQLSTLTVVLKMMMYGNALLDRSDWNTFLAVLTRSVFKGIKRVTITLDMYNLHIPEHRRCVRRLYQMIPEWLAPIQTRGILWVQIIGDQDEAQDGLYMEGDELVPPESESESESESEETESEDPELEETQLESVELDELGRGATNSQVVEEETIWMASSFPLPLAPSTSLLPRLPPMASFFSLPPDASSPLLSRIPLDSPFLRSPIPAPPIPIYADAHRPTPQLKRDSNSCAADASSNTKRQRIDFSAFTSSQP